MRRALVLVRNNGDTLVVDDDLTIPPNGVALVDPAAPAVDDRLTDPAGRLELDPTLTGLDPRPRRPGTAIGPGSAPRTPAPTVVP